MRAGVCKVNGTALTKSSGGGAAILLEVSNVAFNIACRVPRATARRLADESRQNRASETWRPRSPDLRAQGWRGALFVGCSRVGQVSGNLLDSCLARSVGISDVRLCLLKVVHRQWSVGSPRPLK